MNIKQALDSHFTEHYDKYLTLTKKMSKGVNEEPSDIVNETICEIYSLPIEKQTDLITKNYLQYYVIQIIKYSLYSKTSKYYRKYNILKIDHEFELTKLKTINQKESYFDIEKAFKKVLEILNECTWYDREVVLRYSLNNKSFQQMSNETKIPASSLWTSYKNTIEYVKKRLKDEN